MANPEHLEILKQGVEAWNVWRESNPTIQPDLSGAELKGVPLKGVNLLLANLRGANLEGVDLSPRPLERGDRSYRVSALGGADLSAAKLTFSNLNFADLLHTCFEGAYLDYTILRATDLTYANLRRADIRNVDFTHARLDGTDFSNALFDSATFGSNDLSVAVGLDSVEHLGPSSLGISTIYRSNNRISSNFLVGCGVPDEFVAYIPSLLGAQQAIQFYSCFISYSTLDEEFARRLYSRMRDEHLRVWFAPEDIKGGQKLDEQIERAIQLYDRLLLVLSEDSMQSEWVINEIQRARETEIKENRRKLFPITIVDFEKVKAWKRFDADSGRDLAKEVREYFIPDFSDWKDQDAFEKAFDRLLRDLKDEETRP